jgi:voltage-gated potassium channel
MRILGLRPGQDGYRILLWAFGGLLVLRPAIAEFVAVPWLLPLLFSIVMLVSVWAVSRKPRHVIVVATLAVIAVSGEWSRLTGYGLNQVIPGLASVIALAWVAVVLAKDVFRERDYISADMIYGGINTYLLITVAFAAAYKLLILLVPDSISGLSADSPTGDMIYYSAVTITTLGYGDISPVSDGARMLAFVEALFGQLYIAVLLAKLVATHISGKVGSDSQS